MTKPLDREGAPPAGAAQATDVRGTRVEDARADDAQAKDARTEDSAHAARAPHPVVLRDLFQPLPADLRSDFRPLRPGVSMLPLYGEPGVPSTEPSAALLQYEPGASIPAHHHPGYEHIVVLDGSQSDERGTYPRGTCLINPPGSRHAVQSPEGCLVLAIWNQSVEMLDG